MTRKKTKNPDPSPTETPEIVSENAADSTDEETVQLRAERDEFLDRLQRLKAEFDNYQKRIRREREDWRRQTEQALIAELLPLIDDLERALDASREAGESSGLHEGVVMIHAQLLRQLEGHGLSLIDAVGQPFDPAFHDAVFQEDSADHPDKTVLEAFRKGYTMEGRVVRPAQVKISRAPSTGVDVETAEDEDGPEGPGGTNADV